MMLPWGAGLHFGVTASNQCDMLRSNYPRGFDRYVLDVECKDMSRRANNFRQEERVMPVSGGRVDTDVTAPVRVMFPLTRGR